MHAFVASMALFLFALPAAGQGACLDLFTVQESKQIIPSTGLDRDVIVVLTPKSELTLSLADSILSVSLKLENGPRSSDLSYDAIVFTILQINVSHIQRIIGRTVYARAESKMTREQLENTVVNIEKAVSDLQTLAEKIEPASLREKSDFDFDSPLTLFHNALAPNKTPSSFYRHYETHFKAFKEKLPIALKAVLNTEYFLPSAPAYNQQLASMILQAVYRVSPQQAEVSLAQLRDKFILFLESSDSRTLSSSVYQYGLIPMNDLLPKAQYISTGVAAHRPKGHDFEAPTTDGYSRSGHPTKENFDFLYEGPATWSRRTPLIEDLPFEILDYAKITAIKYTYGVETLEQLARVPAIHLLYDLGSNNLTRNELRDLYFYLRDDHYLRMSITDELATRLNIFR